MRYLIRLPEIGTESSREDLLGVVSSTVLIACLTGPPKNWVGRSFRPDDLDVTVVLVVFRLDWRCRLKAGLAACLASWRDLRRRSMGFGRGILQLSSSKSGNQRVSSVSLVGFRVRKKSG